MVQFTRTAKMLLPVLLLSLSTCAHSQFFHKRSPIEELEHLRPHPKVVIDPYQRTYDTAYAYPPRWTNNKPVEYQPYDYENNPEDEAYYMPDQEIIPFYGDFMPSYVPQPPEDAFDVERRNRKALILKKEVEKETTTTPPHYLNQATPAVLQLSSSGQDIGKKKIEPLFRPSKSFPQTNIFTNHRIPIPLMASKRSDPLADELSNLKKSNS